MSRIIIACALVGILGVPAKAAQEKVSFPSTDGTTLTGYLYKPAGPGPFPAVVGMHRCGGVVDDKGEIDLLYRQWGEILSSMGYYVLLVDGFRPRGQSNLCLMQPVSIRPFCRGKKRSETHLAD
jgi:dienelactone hydrolase